MNAGGGSRSAENLDSIKRRQSHRGIPWNISLSALGPLRGLFRPAQRLVEPYVKRGQVAADLGCGTGYYSFVMAQSAESPGKVYAVDLDQKCIQTLEKRKSAKGFGNIEARACSASELGFIADNSVDFVLANGLM